jgi:hypothetical protein
MVYISVPNEPCIEHGENKEDCDKLSALFLRYGYKIAFFGHQEITFYVVMDQSKDGFVPIHSRYCMDRKEFAAFVHLMRRLDTAEKKSSQLLIDWATQKSMEKIGRMY